jgi:hypothetical protein
MATVNAKYETCPHLAGYKLSARPRYAAFQAKTFENRILSSIIASRERNFKGRKKCLKKPFILLLVS